MRPKPRKHPRIMNIRGTLLVCFLCNQVQGFLEVGVYSRLDTNQFSNHSTEITGWKDAGNKGMDSFNAVKDNSEFSISFTAPLQGVYYISTILLVERTDNALLKITLLINHNLKNKTGLTGFQSYNDSVTVSGLAQLFTGDAVSVYVECKGISWTVLSGSTFFVQLVQSVTIHPAFQASLSHDIKILSSNWHRLEDWNTESPRDFRIMSGFSQSFGTVCMSFDGIYQVQANILLDLAQHASGSAVLLFQHQTIISENHLGGGLHATASFGGILKLKKGECLDLKVRSLRGTLTVRQESGFSVLFLTTDAKLVHASSYYLSTPRTLMSSVGIYAIARWTARSVSVFFESNSGLLLNETHYQVQKEGQYLINAHINMRTTSLNQKESAQVLVIVDYTSSSVESEASIIAKETVSSVNSLALTGVLYLNKGQTITLCISKDGNSTMSLETSSLFSIAMVPKDWPGVSATLATDQPITNPGWNEIGNWTTGDLAEGSFSFDGAFDTLSGRYVTPLEGTYIVSCNMIVKGTVGPPLKMMVAVDGKLDMTTGLYAYRKAKKDLLTLSASGLIRLLPGQRLSVFVHIEGGGSWTLALNSLFSVALNGAGKADEHGFLGVKTQRDNYTTNTWNEVKGWQLRNSPIQLQDRWDAEKSRYTPLEEGIYLVSVSLLISHITASRFQVLIAGDGKTTSDQFSGGQNYHSAQNTNSMFSLTASCSVKLSPSHYISVFVKSLDGGSWSVLGNSSMSIVLMYLTTNPFRIGINLKTTTDYFAGYRTYKRFLVVKYDDTYGSTYSEGLSNHYDTIHMSGTTSGLYFVQVVFKVSQWDESKYGTFTGALCIYMGSTQKYIALKSTKKGEGPSADDIIGVSTFGVVFLKKGINVYPCSRGQLPYDLKIHAGFSLARIVPRDMNPGLRQKAVGSVTDQWSRQWTAVGDWSTRGESSLYRLNAINLHGQHSVNTSRGTYLFTSSLSVRENPSAIVAMCIGNHQCSKCYLQSSIYKGGLTLSGIITLPAWQSVYTCVRHGSPTITQSTTRSAQFLPQATANTSLFFRHHSLEFTSNGLKSLNKWTSDDGLIHKNIHVVQAGMYLVAINIAFFTSSDTVLKVSVKLKTNGTFKVVPGLHGESWTQPNHTVPFGLTGLVRIPPGNTSSLDVTVSSDPCSSWRIEANATLSLALLTTTSTLPGFAVKIPFHEFFSFSPSWSFMSDWENVDIGLVSTLSSARLGRYIVDENGIYLVATTLIVSAEVPAGTECIFEMVISIGGIVHGSSLKTLQIIQGQQYRSARRTVSLSIASSVRLYKWQAVFPMVRSSIDLKNVKILAGNVFFVALIEKQRYYSKVDDSLIPHITFHPLPYVQVLADVCQTITLMCRAQPVTNIRYKWTKDGQFYKEVQNLVIPNVRLSDAGRYKCVVESNNISLVSSPSIVEVLATNPVLSSHYNASLKENLSNQTLLILHFTALSKSNQQANVSFTIVAGNVNDTFKIHPSLSNNVTSLINTSPLDYEQADTHQLTIVATNTATHQLTAVLVTIRVLDVNDNSPVFSPQYYSTSIPEHAWVGALIIQVTTNDKDRGRNGEVQYSISSGNEGGVFVMSLQGFVVVNRSLDYEIRKWYNLTITARDLGEPSLQAVNDAYVIINVTDTNDIDPVFSSSTYYFSISENSPVSLSVGMVDATDGEEGSNGNIIYSIQDVQMQEIFSMGKTNGEITLLRSPNYEVNQTFDFVVMATDQGSPPRLGVALVRVSILDVNDNAPVFVSDGYSANITEATLVGTKILCVDTEDKDSELHSKVGYKITHGDLGGVFSINDLGIIILDKTLDRENTLQYNLTIEAHDGLQRAVTSVLINVQDINDHVPQFNATTYVTSIPENTAIGKSVLQIYATDQDAGHNGHVSYLLDDECSTPSVNQTFVINRFTGVVSLIKEIDYDTLDEKSLRLRVVAKDGGSPPLISYVSTVVMVTDVNDNAPVFYDIPTAVVHIPDNYPKTRPIFTFNARDKDSDTNAQIVYSIKQVKKNGEPIQSNPFKINSTTGGLFVYEDLDKNSKVRYEVVISARDSGTPSLSNKANVTIEVDDDNNHSPVFNQSLYTAAISRSVKKDFPLVTVNAADNDFGNNAVIDYSIELFNRTDGCGEKVTFRIASNGSIYLDHDEQELESGCVYTLIVTAKDRGEPPLNGTTKVWVKVEAKTHKKGNSDAATFKKQRQYIITGLVVTAVLLIIFIGFLVLYHRRRRDSRDTSDSTNKNARSVQLEKIASTPPPG